MFNTSKKFFIYYLISTISFFSLSLGWFYYFYSKGVFDFEKAAWLHEGASKIEDLKGLDPYKEIKILINSDRTKESYKIIEKLEKNINSLKLIGEKDKAVNLKNGLVSVQNRLHRLLEYSDVQGVITVLQNKLLGFENFVELNNWKTLSRMSSRSNQHLMIYKTKKNNLYSYERLKELSSSLNSEFNMMISTTEGSVLAIENKNRIIEQIKGLRIELGMLDRYLNELVFFDKETKILLEQYKEWMNDTYPKVTFAKIELERSSKTMALSSIALLVFLCVFFLVGVFIFIRSEKSNQELIEKDVLSLIKDKMLATKDQKFISNTSLDFENEIYKIKDYIHKRMNFGSLFQAAAPFSTLLLDENLNVVWANTHFFEQWGLTPKSNKSDHMTWNYLQQYTNLGHDDPILEALKNKVAGIYQIQVKTRENEDTVPYEMYVSPVENSDKSYIMLFFYPLRSLIETINNQTKALVGPISRTLEMLSRENFNRDNQEKIKKDYQVAGIEGIHDRFIEYFNFIQSQKNGLMSVITQLEDTLYDQNKINDDLIKMMGSVFEKYQTVSQAFEILKGNIVNTVDGRNEIIQLFYNCSSLFKTTFRDVQDLSKTCSVQLGLISELSKGLGTIVQLKDNLKQNKSQTDENKLRLNLSVDQAAIFSRSDEKNNSKLEQSLSKIKLEARSLEKSVNALIEGATSFDIAVSKLLLVMEKYETPDMLQTNDNLMRAKTIFEDELFKMGKVEKLCASEEEKIISGMKNLFSDLVYFKKGLNQMNTFLGDSKKILLNNDNEAENFKSL